MKPVTRVVGRALPLDRANVDTDQIIPAHWLKRTLRTGYKDGLFEAWRKDPEFVLNDQRFRGAAILVAGANFGSGSSREHAVWALQENGFEAVIAPSFADIFRNNAVKCGLLTAQLPADVVTSLMRAVETEPSILIVIDVAERTVMAPAITAQFPLDDHTQHRLLSGLDDIDLTMRHQDEITRFEARRPEWLPRLRA